MRRVVVPFLLLISMACSRQAPEESYHAKSLSPKKQKQRIASLQKKLESAEKEQVKIHEEVEWLRHQMQSAELALIRRKVEDYEDRLRELEKDPIAYSRFLQLESAALFLSEREILHQMIQAGPSPSSFEAEAVLDQILRFITNLSDEDRGQL